MLRHFTIACLASLEAPARSVDDESHQATGDDTGHGESDDPAHVDPGDHAPVNSPPGTGAETDADSRASNALRGRDGELYSFQWLVRCCGSARAPRRIGSQDDILRRVAMIMVIALPNSIEKPRDGECRVMRLPKFLMMLYP